MDIFSNYDHNFWGDIATWVGSVGSILAFFTAAIVFLFDRRSNKRNFSHVEAQIRMAIEQLDIQKFQIESEQASKIGVWFELQRIDEQSEFYGEHERDLVSRWRSVSARMRRGAAPGSEADVAEYIALKAIFGEAGPSKACWVLAVAQNSSDLPVYEFKVRLTGMFRGQSTDAEALSLPIFAPTSGKTSLKVSPKGEPLILPEADQQAFLTLAQPVVIFRDRSGIGWKRDGRGKLAKLSP